MPDVQLSAELTAKVVNFVKGMKTAVSSTTEAESKITKSVNGISNIVSSKLSGVFSAAAIIGFGKAVIDVTAEFQKFQAVLGNTLGSASLANLKLKEIQEFASQTPFAVNELTGAFVKLANSGFKPTGDQMRSLGDLASSTGKSFDQLAEAILDAQSGEFERLKEFGVRAKDAGDSVIFTYKGVQTQVEKTSEAIRNYVTNLGNAEGTSGSMAKISATLGGQISNLGDNWDQMLLSVGGNTEGVFNSSIRVINAAINKITQYNRELNTASKYNLGGGKSDFLNQLNRGVNPFASKGATGLELSVSKIQTADEKVREFVSTTLTGAKSVDDFGKALLELKNRADLALSFAKGGGAGAVSNLSKELSKQNIKTDPVKLGEKLGLSILETTNEVKAIKDVYKEGFKAIQDARANFLSEGTNNANFGTAKVEKSVKSLSDILKELQEALLLNENQFRSTFSERNEGAIAAHQSAVDSLLKNGYSPLSKEVVALKKAMQDLLQLPELPVGPSANSGIEAPRNSKGNTDGVTVSAATKAPEILDEEHKNLLAKQRQFNNEFSEIATSGVTGGLSGIGEAIGGALASGGNVLEAVGQSLLSSLSNILVELGKAAIAVGVGMLAIKAAFKNPLTAIAAGVALVALGSFIGNKVSQITTGGGGDQTQQARPVPRFASGVQNFRGGLALVGEQGPELVNLPTGASVTPNGPTKRMIQREDRSGINISTDLGIKMDRLVANIRVTERKMGRTM